MTSCQSHGFNTSDVISMEFLIWEHVMDFQYAIYMMSWLRSRIFGASQVASQVESHAPVLCN